MISTISRYYRINLYNEDTDEEESFELTLKPERVSKDIIHFEIKWESGNYTQGYVGFLDNGILFLDVKSHQGTTIQYPITYNNIRDNLIDIKVYDIDDREAAATSIEVICGECLGIPIIADQDEILPF
jgi:hypothetical protein